jgi:pyridoxine/pyridoxamine 5'-phosphate oxidase
MPDREALAQVARAVLDRSAYLTLATADADGRPWVSPVWFACEDHRTFWWVSMPDAVHSRNIAERPDVAIVVFDTGVAVGAAQAVYARAVAAQVDDPDGLRVFSQASVAAGLSPWSMEDVTSEGGLRLYRAVATEVSVLDSTTGHGRDERFTVDLRSG